MKNHLMSASLVVTAFALETLGFAGAIVLLAAGVGCEVWFWVRIVRGRRSRQAPRAA